MSLERGADPEIQASRREVTALEFAREALAERKMAGIRAGHPEWKNFEGVIALRERN